MHHSNMPLKIQIIISQSISGLAYGYNMYVRLHEQLVYFTLYRATNCANAFKQFKQITVCSIVQLIK